MVHLLKNTRGGSTEPPSPPSLTLLDPTFLRQGALPQIFNSTHLFLPINDSREDRGGSGTHWSLLVVGLSDRIAFHYDSLDSANFSEAQIVHSKLEQLLGYTLKLANLRDTPQQDNGSDCGVHVCWAMRQLLVTRLLVIERQKEAEMSLGGCRVDASKMRREMYRVCERLRKKAGRR